MPTLQIKITDSQSRRLYLNALNKEVSQSELIRSLIDGLADLQLVPAGQEAPSAAAPQEQPPEAAQAVGFHRDPVAKRQPNPEFQAALQAQLAQLKAQL